jgi:anti-sigma regulatory factor (Ser/Thr protein kinase)
MKLVGEYDSDTSLKDTILEDLAEFTGPDWEQEDDITMVTLQRSEGYGVSEVASRSIQKTDEEDRKNGTGWQLLTEFKVPSAPGNERLAMEQVVEAVRELNLPRRRLDQLKTAVGEATMNAMEHGNHYLPDRPVSLQVLASQAALSVRITDHGGTRQLPADPGVEIPDIEAKLAEQQTPRGWGLFLIKHMVDDMRISNDMSHHTVELIMYLEGEGHASEKS